MLKAKKFSAEKFQVENGYQKYTGEWGIVNTETGGWVTFSGDPYRPQGGKVTAVEVANSCSADDMEYVFPIKQA